MSWISKVILALAVVIGCAMTNAHVYAAESDLNNNGLLDSTETEVVVDSYAALPAGEYTFNNLTITNNALLVVNGDPGSTSNFKGVKITATNLTIASGSHISADAQGYVANEGPGHGYQTGSYYAGVGGSYGGVGGAVGFPPVPTYGSATHPTDLGSGGSITINSDRGGGAITLVVGDTFTNDGSVSADGGPTASGGSIYVITGTFSGTGDIHAHGGSGIFYAWPYPAGGGGRVAVYYHSSTFAGSITASGGTSYGSGADGTVGLFDVTNNDFYAGSSWRFQKNDGPFNFNHIYVTNAQVTTEEDVSITANQLNLDADGTLDKSTTLSLGSTTTLAIPTIIINGASVMTLSGSDAITADTVTLTHGAAISVVPEHILTLTISNLFISAGSGMYAQGIRGNIGGVRSGGDMRLNISDTLTNNGTIAADGGITMSGGSISITAKKLAGSGAISANGGPWSLYGIVYRAGDGGTITVHYQTSTFTGQTSVLGGTGSSYYGNTAGIDGTVIMKKTSTVSNLSLPNETEYTDNGLYPDKGVANKDLMTFKTVYTDADGTPADKVHVAVDNMVDFNTDEFYPYHVSLPKEAVFVDGVDIFYSLIGTRVVGLDRGLFDGKGLNEGDVLEIPLLRSNIRRATTTLAVVESITRIGDANGEFKLEALGTSGQVLAQQSIVVDLPSGVPDNINVQLAVSADADITSLRLTVLHTNDTVGWLKNIMTEADVPMQNDGDNSHFTASRIFPKGTYTYFFTASSTDGLTGRYPENGGALSFTTGYSSVAFVPGIEASRLFDAHGIVNDNQLWEPNRDGDVQKLAMYFDATLGTSRSSNTEIYTKTNGGIIGEVNVISPTGPGVSADVYVDFINDMNTLVEKGTIAEWKALPYDWRLDFTNLLKSGKEVDGKIYYDKAYETSAPYILEQIKRFAENSDSGKVTIVAHSMGGLIAKKMLYDIEHDPSSPYHSLIQDKKIDLLILVASPQLGTPDAITGILHGYEQELDIPHIGWPNFAKGETMRALGTTMQSAYNLLPAEMYTTKVSDIDGQVFRPADSALVSFDSETLKNLKDPLFNAASTTAYYRMHYPEESNGATTTIRSYDAMRDFLAGTDGHTSAADSDLTHPKTLTSTMLDRAQILHEEIDSWASPDVDSDGVPDIRVVQIAGWGMQETVKGVTYGAKEVPDGPFECGLIGCGFSGTRWVLDIRPDFTYDGDATVVVPSAVEMGEVSDVGKNLETYYINLYNYNKDNYFLFLDPIDRSHGDIFEVTNVRDLIENLVQYKSDPTANLTYIKKTQAELPKDSLIYLRLSMHSPVDVHIYDKEGNHVGVSSTTGIFDENIPNSYYLEFGEGKYLGVPLETSEQYTIKLEGTGLGIFTFEMAEEKAGVVQKTETFSNIPVSTTTKSVFTLSSLNDVSEIVLDYDGDGSVDDVEFSDEYKSAVTFSSVQIEIQKLSGKMADSLAKQVENAKKLSDKKLYFPAQVLLETVQKQLFIYSKTKTNKQSKIKYSDALRISAMLDVLIDDMKKKRGEKVSGLKEKIESIVNRWKEKE